MTRLPSTLPAALALLLLIGIADAAVLFMQFWWSGPIFDGTTSGVWTALAFDFSEGTLYRPIMSDVGYGGTRYQPLFFMLHGTLIATGLGPIASGVIAMQSSVAAMVLGIFAILRRAGVQPAMAIALASVTFCTTIYEQYLSDVNCDYLAAALSLFALALYQGDARNGPVAGWARLTLVGLLGTLAFYTKFTTLYVPAAVLLHLLIIGQWRRAALFAGMGLGMLALIFGILQAISQGQMWVSLAATASGGTDLEYALGFPGRFLREIFYENPSIGVTFVVAAVVWAARFRTHGADPISLAFVMVSLDTILIFVSRGIAGNHVIALHAFSLVMIGTGLGQAKLRAMAAAGFAAMSVIVTATWIPGVPSPRKSLDLQGLETAEELRNTIYQLRAGTGPVLSNHPAVPVILGERAFVLDMFNLARFLRNDPVIAEDLSVRLTSKAFSLIVLVSPFLDGRNGLISESYVESRRVGRFQILVPRPDF